MSPKNHILFLEPFSKKLHLTSLGSISPINPISATAKSSPPMARKLKVVPWDQSQIFRDEKPTKIQWCLDLDKNNHCQRFTKRNRPLRHRARWCPGCRRRPCCRGSRRLPGWLAEAGSQRKFWEIDTELIRMNQDHCLYSLRCVNWEGATNIWTHELQKSPHGEAHDHKQTIIFIDQFHSDTQNSHKDHNRKIPKEEDCHLGKYVQLCWNPCQKKRSWAPLQIQISYYIYIHIQIFY